MQLLPLGDGMAERAMDMDGARLFSGLELQDATGRVAPVWVSPELCDAPLCACTEMRLFVRPERPEDAVELPEAVVPIDLVHCVLIDTQKHPLDPAVRVLAESLLAKLTPELWEEARNYFVATKEAQLAGAELATLQVDFPRELAWDASMLVSYGILVPHARPLLFRLENVIWQALDDYCVNPDCTCEDVFLTFRAWPEGAPWGPSVHEDDIEDAPVACLTLSGSKWDTEEPSPAGFPSLERLMTALEAAWPDLRTLLRSRRVTLRQLAEAPSSIVGSGLRVPVPAVSTKIGRNEPCPCGSGKKYKRCCG